MVKEKVGMAKVLVTSYQYVHTEKRWAWLMRKWAWLRYWQLSETGNTQDLYFLSDKQFLDSLAVPLLQSGVVQANTERQGEAQVLIVDRLQQCLQLERNTDISLNKCTYTYIEAWHCPTHPMP